MTSEDVKRLSDAELLTRVEQLAAELRVNEVKLLIHLAEVEDRLLHAKGAYPSLFAYCVDGLKFAEGAACRRIAAMRAARLFPEIYDHLTDGRLHVTGIAMLAPHLTRKNCSSVLERASGKKKRDLERLIAELAPRPDCSDLVRRLGDTSLSASALPPPSSPAWPTAPTASSPLTFALSEATAERPTAKAAVASGPEPAAPAAPKSLSKVEPLSAGRNLVRFAASDEFVKDLEHATELLSNKYPECRIEDVLGEALKLLIAKRDPLCKPARQAKPQGTTKTTAKTKAKKATTPAAAAASATAVSAAPAPVPDKPRQHSRYVPVSVVRAAREESRGQCTYSHDGKRCTARRYLKKDHVQPYALGGRSDNPENIREYCYEHNKLAALETYGPAAAQFYTIAGGGMKLGSAAAATPSSVSCISMQATTTPPRRHAATPPPCPRRTTLPAQHRTAAALRLAEPRRHAATPPPVPHRRRRRRRRTALRCAAPAAPRAAPLRGPQRGSCRSQPTVQASTTAKAEARTSPGLQGDAPSELWARGRPASKKASPTPPLPPRHVARTRVIRSASISGEAGKEGSGEGQF